MSESLEKLRREFDGAFAFPPASKVADVDSFLAIRIGADPYAIRVEDISSILPRQKISRLPSRQPTLLGLAGFRGRIVAVFDLASLLGYESRSKDPRWLIVSAHDRELALAFEELEGYVQVPRTADPVLSVDGISRTIVDLRSILKNLKEG
jgi:purine-binding chemotaxis protein CheW